LALAYSSRTANATRSELGSRFAHLQNLDGMPLTLFARFAWVHDWTSPPSLNAAFQTLPGASFTVNGAAPATDSALASAGAVRNAVPARVSGGHASLCPRSSRVQRIKLTDPSAPSSSASRIARRSTIFSMPCWRRSL
jgi:hypothetical protein